MPTVPIETLRSLLVALLAGGYLLYEARLRAAERRSQAAGRVLALESAEIRAVPLLIEQLQPYRSLVVGQLRSMTRMEANDPDSTRRRLHAALALLPDDPVGAALELLVLRDSA